MLYNLIRKYYQQLLNKYIFSMFLETKCSLNHNRFRSNSSVKCLPPEAGWLMHRRCCLSLLVELQLMRKTSGHVMTQYAEHLNSCVRKYMDFK